MRGNEGSKDLLMKLFAEVGRVLGVSDALEYILFSQVDINVAHVRSFVADTIGVNNEQDNQEVQDIVEGYSFTDVACMDMCEDKYDYETYPFAADYLLSDYCTDKEFSDFVTYLCTDEVGESIDVEDQIVMTDSIRKMEAEALGWIER